MGDITITEAQAEEMAATLRMMAGLTMDTDHAFTLTALAVYLEVSVEEQTNDAVNLPVRPRSHRSEGLL